MTLLQRAADYLKSAATYDIDQALADFQTHERGLPIRCEKLAKQRRKIMAARRHLIRLSDEVSKLGKAA